MTIDEAIKHCLEVAEKNDGEAEVYDLLAKNHNNTYEKLTASRFYTDCAECAADHKQLAEWLTELKEAKKFIRKLQNELLKGTSFYSTSFYEKNEELMNKLTEGVEYLDD